MSHYNDNAQYATHASG